jgi:hypothetical protein
MKCSNCGEQRLVRQPALGGFGDAEINHLRHRHAVVQRDEDVRRLDVAMDDALLVRVLDGVADLDEQIQPLLWSRLVLVAVIRDAHAAHQFHHEVRPARVGRARIQHARDVRMIHHRQRLPLRLEPGDDLLVSMPSLMTLSATRRRTGSVLFGHVDHAAAAFADFLEQFVGSPALRQPRMAAATIPRGCCPTATPSQTSIAAGWCVR